MSMNAVLVAPITSIKEQNEKGLRGISGSIIGAILGLSPYMSPMEAHARISGLMDGPEDNMYMKMGRTLEPIVAQLYQEETGNKVSRVNYLLADHEHEFMTGNIDRRIHSKERGPGVLEIKTASEYQDGEWRNNRIPPHYYCQIQWYLMLTGWMWGAFAVLVGGNKFYTIDVERDEHLIDLMRRRAIEFWHGNILTGIPPQADGSDSCKKALEAIFPQPQPLKMTELPDEAFDCIQTYEEASRIIKDATETKEEVANKLRAMLGDAESGIWNGQEVVTWKATTRGNRLLKVKGVK